MPAESTKRKALETLDNMRLIVKRGRLKHEGYVSEIVDEKLHQSGAICDGRNYCMLGTAWVAYGVKLTADSWEDDLPGVSQGFRRDDFLAHRPGLKLVYDALNQAARVRLDRLGYGRYREDERISFKSEAEAYFENVMSDWGNEKRERRATYSLLDAAKKIVEAA